MASRPEEAAAVDAMIDRASGAAEQGDAWAAGFADGFVLGLRAARRAAAREAAAGESGEPDEFGPLRG